MEKELQSKLVEILGAIQTATGKAADFTMAQLPDIAQSYVVYGRVTYALYALVWASLFAASMWVALRKGFFNTTAVHTKQYYEGDWHESRVAAAVLGTLAAFPCCVGVVNSLSGAALVWFAPKVWLLKELAQLVK